MRLLLLTASGEWSARLRRAIDALGTVPGLITAPSWAAASNLFEDGGQGLVFCTPDCRPPADSCSVPLVLLLEAEPAEEPVGVCDWLVAGAFSVDVLRRCLRYVREQGNLKQTLQRLAEQDPLTGIANRQGFQTLLAARLAECGGRGLVLGHLDLDNFRHANDALGYQAGDRLILQVVARLKSLLQPCDQLARLGSDEFAQRVHADIRELWHWHALEELEHKSVTWDVYELIGTDGPERGRAAPLVVATVLPAVLFGWAYLLVQQGVWNAQREQALVGECQAEVQRAVETFEATPVPPAEAALEHVYGQWPQALAEQREWLRERAARREVDHE